MGAPLAADLATLLSAIFLDKTIQTVRQDKPCSVAFLSLDQASLDMHQDVERGRIKLLCCTFSRQ